MFIQCAASAWVSQESRASRPSCVDAWPASATHGTLSHTRSILGFLRHGAGGDAIKLEPLERRQRAAGERGDEGGAPGVSDLGVDEV